MHGDISLLGMLSLCRYSRSNTYIHKYVANISFGINIKNMEGKLMKNVPVTSSSMTVNLDGFESGVYFVEVSHAGGNETLKFIKE